MAHFAIYCLPNDVKHFILKEKFFNKKKIKNFDDVWSPRSYV